MIAVNDLDTPTGKRERKAFATLAAQYAMRGYVLIKGDPAIEGQVHYCVMRWRRLAQPLEGLQAATDYLATLTRAGEAGHGQELQSQ